MNKASHNQRKENAEEAYQSQTHMNQPDSKQ